MKISKRGLDELIKPHEGYLTKQPDGSCKAYRCPAGVWTCGWGCTEGVTAHKHWTLMEASAALAAEMETHEANVERLVSVPLNQRQFDALVSLCYNIGAGNLGKSALIKHLNAGDYARAASHFGDFKYAKIQGDTAKRMKVKPGTSVVLPGLVERRANEAAMFLEAEPVLDAMPQKVEAATVKMRVGEAVAKVGAPLAAVAGTAATQAPAIPGLPPAVTESLTNIAAYQALGGKMLALATLPNAVLIGAGGLAYVLLVVVLPKLGIGSKA